MSVFPDPEAQPAFYKDVPLKRLLAWVVDTVVIGTGCILILPFTAFTGLFFFPLLLLAVGFAYRVVTIANYSATLGMLLFAIELRQADGTRMSAGNAFAHTLGYTLSWTVPVFQLISAIMMATTERGQGLSDTVLQTVMINKRAAFR